MTAPHKQVSEAALTSSAPPRRGNNLLMLFILGCLVAVVTGITLYWLDASKPGPETHVTQWPRDIPPDPNGNTPGDYEAALAHMHELATALLAYREGSMGGGVRWPGAMDELQMAGLLEPRWNYTGVLSGRPIVYQPEMPIGHDPERWVICHDIELSRRRTQTGYSVLTPSAAVVILADGSVKLIEGEDLLTYGGLSHDAGAGR